jgi:probable H4MPT-linked C1 transfer pathway protein
MKPRHYLGWDIGGAHLKAAVLNSDGIVTALYQQPCPLWKGLATLQAAVTGIMQALPAADYRHAMTMTGELVDLFADREDGVRQIIATMARLLPASEILVFAGRQGLLPLSAISPADYQDIASSNWLASAGFAAHSVGDGLFIDIGSTTTDVLVLQDRQVQVQGYTDYQRLVTKELVYTGIVRTAVMAVAQTVLDEGQEVGLMAEYFATMADVYRLTGELDEAHDQTETADGAAKTVAASARRLARMLGCDFYPEQLPRWQSVAADLRARQLQAITAASGQVLAKSGISAAAPLVGAGIGRFLVRELARHWQRPYRDFSELCQCSATTLNPADCAPAVAVGYLNHAFVA